jgi:protein-S-isoprenylcysteine O-methyltransferase Ste14
MRQLHEVVLDAKVRGLTRVCNFRRSEGWTVPNVVVGTLWFVWIVSWWASAKWSSTPVKRAGIRRELPNRIVTLLGAYGLFARLPARIDPQWLDLRGHVVLAWAMVALVALGFAFTWWARIHLGRLWSATVTRKPDHHVVDTGPYALVRHPIYTGIIAAAIGTALLRGYVLSFAGAALMTLGFYFKARLEEEFLRGELGREAYDAYARRVPMLIPLAA